MSDTLGKIGTYERFKQLFEKYSREAGKEQYLIPYFIAAHPGTTDEDMLNLALWLKRNNFRLDQVQTFLPTPMALATTMYHTELNPLKKVLIASGVRYDLAIESPEYVKELAQHHVGGYLKIAPEAIAEGPLSKMMKPGVGTYYRFKALFDRYSKEAGLEQYLIPYFIAAHPGTTDEDMVELALWLKHNGFRPDQVQAFPG